MLNFFHKDPCLCSSIEIRNYYKLLHQHLHRLIPNLYDGNANTRWGTFFNKQEFIPIIRLFIIFRSVLRNVLGRIEINILTKTIIWDIARVLYFEIMEVRLETMIEFTTRCLPVVYNYNGRKVITWFLQISIKTNI